MDINFVIKTAHAAAETAAESQSPGVVGLLGLNLKLFIAQLINFGIVLLVLWKWVFKPVSRNLQKRTEKIDQSLKQAAEIAQEKEHFDAWKTKEISAVRTQAGAIIDKSKSEAANLKSEILAKAKAEQAVVVAQGLAEIESAKQKAVSEAKSQLADLVVLAAEKVLKEKLDPAADKKLIKEALKEAAR